MAIKTNALINRIEGPQRANLCFSSLS